MIYSIYLIFITISRMLYLSIPGILSIILIQALIYKLTGFSIYNFLVKNFMRGV